MPNGEAKQSWDWTILGWEKIDHCEGNEGRERRREVKREGGKNGAEEDDKRDGGGKKKGGGTEDWLVVSRHEILGMK